MELYYAPLFSGSSGNCVFVGCENARLIVDAGVSGARICKSLSDIGVRADELDGILVTHEHADHIQSVGILSRKYDLPIYATSGTWMGMEKKIGHVESKNIRLIDPEREFSVGNITVLPFSTPHDALDPVGYSFQLGASCFALATDIGCVKESWLKYALEADSVLLEANYDPDMLRAGPYPYDLKKRILSRKGHLSNDDSGLAAAKMIGSGTKHIILGHLSKENNFPELALRSVEGILYSEGIDANADVEIEVAKRDAITGLFQVRSGWR
ncbi:MAG: MBL fold metallo-hydrolase [Clostridia bacterium]|nr:MBL fold metallo-hydrolase [Clostridia bacterium]